MNKIQMIQNRETNFVFHMLSVARCGYDNAYGQKHRQAYPAQVLAMLKRHERLITVTGGEHCGALHGLLVGEPAKGKMRAKAFYQEIVRQADAGEAPEYYVENGLVAPAREIAAAMADCYDHYVEQVWPEDEQAIQAHIDATMPVFEQSGFTARAEEAVGCTLPVERFCATMVASVEKGPEGIDISEDQDVFGIARDPETALFFIGHEFIIYLLKHALREEDAFQSFDTWMLTEGLAEYYLKRVLGETRLFNRQQQVVTFLEAIPGHEGLTAPELYRAGYAAFVRKS